MMIGSGGVLADTLQKLSKNTKKDSRPHTVTAPWHSCQARTSDVGNQLTIIHDVE